MMMVMMIMIVMHIPCVALFTGVGLSARDI